MSRQLTGRQLTEIFSCTSIDMTELDTISFSGVAPLASANGNNLSFLANEKYLIQAINSEAGAIICSEKNYQYLKDKTKSKLFMAKDPYLVFAKVSQYFFVPKHPFAGVSNQAYIDESAQIGENVLISPFVFVGPGAIIGKNTVLYPGVFIGAGSTIGENCLLYPNCVVREGCQVGYNCILNPGVVIGGDGFGFAPSGMENIKIPQTGGVIVGNDVEIGSNSSIDRGAIDNTQIGKQTKIDSLVQIGHNAVIGDACFIVAQVGVAGSVEIGNRVTLAGQSGVAGHLKICDGATILAQAGVTKSINVPGLYSGNPARPNQEYLQQLATINKITKERKAKKNNPREGDN